MSTLARAVGTTTAVVGAPMNRVDGRLKVRGAAPYPLDVDLPGMAHAVIVQSRAVSGRIASIATRAAEESPGVIAVVTHANAQTLARGPMTPLGASPLPPLQRDEILHYGQHIALVIAETLEQAQEAAARIEVTYDRDGAGARAVAGAAPAIVSMQDPRADQVSHPWIPDQSRGDVDRALASADVRVDATYTTADNTHNPLGLFTTVAEWDGNGETLTLHDTTQWPRGVRDSVAQAFGIDAGRVRVLTPYVGGGFGAGLRVWPHVALAALGARVAKRPVKLTLTRAQMFTSVGHRPATVQQIALGATREGQLVAIKHDATSPLGRDDEFFNPIASATPELYACPNVFARGRQVRMNIPPPTWMRAPGHAEGEFALETALDELSYAIGIDPIELRIRNHAPVHPESGLPWSSNATLECYRHGADRFGWSTRDPRPRSMRTRDGRLLVGYGMARAALGAYQAPCHARVTLQRDGSVVVRSAATDIGTGTYTVMTQLTADLLGVPVSRVRVELGDSAMPLAPQQGGSGITGALGNAIHAACARLLEALAELSGPAGGETPRADAYADILARHNLDELTRDGQSEPPSDPTKARAGSFAAHFVEVHVDPDLAIVRVARFVSAVDGGRILNEKTARSQIIGGIVGGIGMALLEESVYDRGRIANASLGEYVVAVNADVPDIDVLFVGEPDTLTPIGTKGIGELSIIGVGAAISNAVYHATGIRMRSLPISLEKVLAQLTADPG